jgi:hypothetical protein
MSDSENSERSNKGGETRGEARAEEVHGLNKEKRETKTTTEERVEEADKGVADQQDKNEDGPAT